MTVLGVNMGSFTNFHGAEMVELATDSDSVFTPVDEEGFGQVVHDINDRLCESKYHRNSFQAFTSISFLKRIVRLFVLQRSLP